MTNLPSGRCQATATAIPDEVMVLLSIVADLKARLADITAKVQELRVRS
ncbi:hypothetical protein JQK88_20425 [Mesorhizobium caraganae]|nr:hypothetical protein [Mesorhizobium caraganae]MBM2713538.1 hypothetical protein [Mesorhizobium caraganae]